MKNKGQILENFVEEIEKILLPQGVKITRNKKLFNDNGVQIAEFDVHIQGKLGATTFTWLIECRNRPSKGAAPSEWIQQLYGRKTSYGLDKVIAVSTTGFAPGAIEEAKRLNIEIRTVTESNLEEEIHWLETQELIILKQTGKMNGLKVVIDEKEPVKLQKALGKLLKKSKPESPILISTLSKKKITSFEAFNGVRHNLAQYYENLKPNGDGKKQLLRVIYTNDNDHFEIKTEKGKVRVREIIFDVSLRLEQEIRKISNIKKYENLSTEEKISTTASFDFEIDDCLHNLSFHNISETGETLVVYKKNPK